MRVARIPGEGPVDAVANRDHAIGPADASHLAQRRDRVGQVLQHLVRVHDVELRIGMLERIDVPDDEIDVGDVALGCRCRCGRDDVGRRVDAEHPTGRDA